MSSSDATVFATTVAATNDYLEKRLAKRVQEAGQMHESYETLWRETTRIVMNGGKRLRPYLVMVGAGRYDPSAIPIAAAQELLHAAMLAHDDIIDQDNVRRGAPNVNGTYVNRYQAYLSPLLAQHYAYSAGILAGDLLLSEAYHCIMSSTAQSELKTRLSETLYQSIFSVVGGELMDVEAAFMRDISYDPIMVSRYKTASYSCIGPLVAGAQWRGAADDVIDKLTEFGAAAGIAFQLQDDLLGVFGDEATTGKSSLSDLREAKATYLIQCYKKTLDDKQLKSFAAVFGNVNATDNELQTLKDAIAATPAVHDTEAKIALYFEKASSIADTMDPFRKNELLALLNKLDKRSA